MTNMKPTKKKLGIGGHQLLALKYANGNVTNNMEEALSVAGKFCTEMYSDQDGQADDDEGNYSLNLLTY